MIKEKAKEDFKECATTAENQAIQQGSVRSQQKTKEKGKAKVGMARASQFGNWREKRRSGPGRSQKDKTRRR